MPRTSVRSRRQSGNRFRGNQATRTHRVTRRTPIESPDGGTQIETVTTTQNRRQSRSERRTPIPSGGSQIEVLSEDSGPQNQRKRSGLPSLPSPTKAGSSAGGVGLLQAEFLGSIMLLIMILFADSSRSYGEKIMTTMKRGTFVFILFFILSLIGGVGPNALRISKAIGALVFVTILLTSPVSNMLEAFDSFAKKDWLPTGEKGTDDLKDMQNANSSSASGGLGGAVSQGVTSAPGGTAGEIAGGLASGLQYAVGGTAAANAYGAALRALKGMDIWKLPADSVNTITDDITGIIKKLF